MTLDELLEGWEERGINVPEALIADFKNKTERGMLELQTALLIAILEEVMSIRHHFYDLVTSLAE